MLLSLIIIKVIFASIGKEPETCINAAGDYHLVCLALVKILIAASTN